MKNKTLKEFFNGYREFCFFGAVLAFISRGIKLIKCIWISLFFLSSQLLAYESEPMPPVFDGDEVVKVIKRSAYASFIAEACDVDNNIAKMTDGYMREVYRKSNSSYEKIKSDFSYYKSFHENNAKTVGILKKCYIDIGKTRILVKRVDEEISGLYFDVKNKMNAYEDNHARWEENIIAERERNEKSQALRLADQLGKFVVSYAYDGGQNVSTNLLSYEKYNDTWRLNVEIRWAGKISGDYGYSADGIIIAIDDSSPTWIYDKNCKWNPSWQSSKLNEYISGRSFGRALRGFMGE